MRKLVEKPFTENLLYCEFVGKSTETKPTTGIVTGSKFTETDTGDVYLFTEGDSPAWAKVSAGWVDPNP